MSQTSSNIPWWLADGDIRCEFCLQLYIYEHERRCTECDAPLCPGCAVLVREVIYCFNCQPADKAPEKDGE